MKLLLEAHVLILQALKFDDTLVPFLLNAPTLLLPSLAVQPAAIILEALTQLLVAFALIVEARKTPLEFETLFVCSFPFRLTPRPLLLETLAPPLQALTLLLQSLSLLLLTLAIQPPAIIFQAANVPFAALPI
jgi:hypothetical protein